MAQLTFLGGRSYSPDASETLGFTVQLSSGLILMECGQYVPLHLVRSGVSVTDLTAVYVSHEHADHVGGLPWLLFSNIMERFYQRAEAGGELTLLLPGSGESPLLAYCRATYPVLFEEGGPVLVKPCDPASEPVSLAGDTFRAFPLDHPVASHGLAVEATETTIAYVPDTAPVDQLAKRVGGAETVVCAVAEPTGARGIAERFKFLTATDAGVLARDVGAKRLVIMHVFFIEDEAACVEEAGRTFDGEIVVARAGLELAV